MRSAIPGASPRQSGQGSPAAAMKPEVAADLRQLMRGILFPNSNVIFSPRKTILPRYAGEGPLAVARSARQHLRWLGGCGK